MTIADVHPQIADICFAAGVASHLFKLDVCKLPFSA